MKTLNLNQMENVQGGAVWACAGGAAAVAIGAAATMLMAGAFGFATVWAMSWTAASCARAASKMGR